MKDAAYTTTREAAYTAPPQLDRIQQRALWVGIGGLAAAYRRRRRS